MGIGRRGWEMAGRQQQSCTSWWSPSPSSSAEGQRCKKCRKINETTGETTGDPNYQLSPNSQPADKLNRTKGKTCPP